MTRQPDEEPVPRTESEGDSLKAGQFTALLRRATGGDLEAEESLYGLVERELLLLARQERRRWHGNFTMDTVALVSNAFIRVRSADVGWQDRRHFFAVTRKAMRQTLFTYAEARDRQRRGGGAHHVDVDAAFSLSVSEASAVFGLRDALDELREADAVLAEIVELRYFIGLQNGEIAALLELGEATVGRKLRAARGFLRNTMGDSGSGLLLEGTA